MSTSYACSQDRLARETVRLPLQAQALFALEWPALQRLGLQSSSRIADLGCGDGTWMSLLQEQCPSALTMGIDPGEAVVRIARERHRGLNFACSTEPGSGLTVLEEFEPDLVTMRFVHQHLQEAESNRILSELRELGSRPRIVVIDVDDRSFDFEPDSPAILRLLSARGERQRVAGGDREVGGKMAERFRHAGFQGVQSERLRIHTGVVGLESWWSIVSPVLFSGRPDSDQEDADEARSWPSTAKNASFEIVLTHGW